MPRAPAGGPRGGPSSSGGTRSRHLLGVFSVVAVFALVGVTLWRPLAVLVALPVIIVLALVVRRAVPVPAPTRAAAAGATGARPRQAPGAPAREARPRPVRYDDRPPYDQEAERRGLPAQPRRSVPSTPPVPADRYRAAGRAEPDEVTERYRVDEPGRPSRRRPAPPAGAPRPDERDERRRPDGRTYPDESGTDWDSAASRRAAEPGRGPFTPPPRDHREPVDPPRAGQRRGGPPADHDDAGRYPAGRAAPGRGADDHYADDIYVDDVYVDDRRRERRRGTEERRGEVPGGPQRAADARYPGQPPRPDDRGQAEWRRQPGDEQPDDYQDRHGPGYDDEYPGHEYAEDEPGRGQGDAAGDRRRRGWRHQVWDDEGWDDAPEPEPDEDMMHTMSIDMRGYLDDTGSFRMP
ncbi:hypothetical protein [Pseudofrankia sp. EUN1h]|uniref:hypothetical protein n=1 Tax=Pseudofrankia sp. EUN1h TaxID=1834515 RepID=UPI0002F4B3DE|nr:hypothetical protein [Pseudofrankia sp. EUN1h]